MDPLDAHPQRRWRLQPVSGGAHLPNALVVPVPATHMSGDFELQYVERLRVPTKFGEGRGHCPWRSWMERSLRTIHKPLPTYPQRESTCHSTPGRVFEVLAQDKNRDS